MKKSANQRRVPERVGQKTGSPTCKKEATDGRSRHCHPLWARASAHAPSQVALGASRERRPRRALDPRGARSTRAFRVARRLGEPRPRSEEVARIERGTFSGGGFARAPCPTRRRRKRRCVRLPGATRRLGRVRRATPPRSSPRFAPPRPTPPARLGGGGRRPRLLEKLHAQRALALATAADPPFLTPRLPVTRLRAGCVLPALRRRDGVLHAGRVRAPGGRIRCAVAPARARRPQSHVGFRQFARRPRAPRRMRREKPREASPRVSSSSADALIPPPPRHPSTQCPSATRRTLCSRTSWTSAAAA